MNSDRRALATHRPMLSWPTYITRAYCAMPPKASCPCKGRWNGRSRSMGLGGRTLPRVRAAFYAWSWRTPRRFRRAIDLMPLSNCAHWYAINHLSRRALRRGDRRFAPRAVSTRSPSIKKPGMKCILPPDATPCVSVEDHQLDGRWAWPVLSFGHQPSCQISLSLRKLEPSPVVGRSPRSGGARLFHGSRATSWRAASGGLRISKACGTSRRTNAQVHVGIGERAEALDRLE